MYNEPYSQLLESLAGIYRNYYELVAKDADYEGRVTVVVVCDGYPAFNKIGIDDKSDFTFVDRLTNAGLYDDCRSNRYYKKIKKEGRINDTSKKQNQDEYELKYSNLGFMEDFKNSQNAEEQLDFETHNLIH